MAPDVLQASTCIPYNHHTHMIQQIDHIGIAVKSLDATVPYYRDALGLGEPHIEEVPTQKVRVAMFDVAGVHIELLEPTSPESAIAKAIEKKGEGCAYCGEWKVYHDVPAAISFFCKLKKCRDVYARVYEDGRNIYDMTVRA